MKSIKLLVQLVLLVVSFVELFDGHFLLFDLLFQGPYERLLGLQLLEYLLLSGHRVLLRVEELGFFESQLFGEVFLLELLLLPGLQQILQLAFEVKDTLVELYQFVLFLLNQFILLLQHFLISPDFVIKLCDFSQQLFVFVSHLGH